MIWKRINIGDKVLRIKRWHRWHFLVKFNYVVTLYYRTLSIFSSLTLKLIQTAHTWIIKCCSYPVRNHSDAQSIKQTWLISWPALRDWNNYPLHGYSLGFGPRLRLNWLKGQTMWVTEHRMIQMCKFCKVLFIEEIHWCRTDKTTRFCYFYYNSYSLSLQ